MSAQTSEIESAKQWKRHQIMRKLSHPTETQTLSDLSDLIISSEYGVWLQQSLSFFFPPACKLKFPSGCRRCSNPFSSFGENEASPGTSLNLAVCASCRASFPPSPALVVFSLGSWGSCIIKAGSSQRSRVCPALIKQHCSTYGPVRGGEVWWKNDSGLWGLALIPFLSATK